MSRNVINIENISKQYRLGEIGTGTVRHDLSRWWSKVRGKEDPFLKIGEINDRSTKGNEKYVWALKDINFNVEEGDVLGIIGKNGAGKSTLLKVLSRITLPSKGSIKIRGRVASLLEVGTGFHPDLSGRENIFLNGAILGMTKNEISRKFDEIVDFAGVERYIDTPVKRYSSGMYVRLAFGVAAHLEPEILIVDEVLAVGDAEFQKKALGKMKEVSTNEGRTVLFVSHNMDAIMNLCKRGVILKNGCFDFMGTAAECITHYQKNAQSISNVWVRSAESDQPHIKRAELRMEGKQPCHQLNIEFSVSSSGSFSGAFVAFDIENAFGTTIMQAIPSITPMIYFDGRQHDYIATLDLVGLVPGSYSVSVWIGPHNTHTYDYQRNILSFDVLHSPTEGRTFPHHSDKGFLVPISKLQKIS